MLTVVLQMPSSNRASSVLYRVQGCCQKALLTDLNTYVHVHAAIQMPTRSSVQAYKVSHVRVYSIGFTVQFA